MKAFAPNGLPITGTLEVVQARALVVYDTFTCGEGAAATDFDYSGETEVFWDEQRTVERGGERVFLDSEGNEWVESELELRGDERA